MQVLVLSPVFLLTVLVSVPENNNGQQCDYASMQLQRYSEEEGNKRPHTITTLDGRRVGDKVNSLTVGKYGPVLMQDTLLLEELSHFDRERIPERVVHAKGKGAFGFFVVTHSEITRYTKASLFSQVGKKTRVFVRFSQVSGGLWSADTVRDVRGFAIKFYTDDGNWDLVGNHLPVFFIKDSMLFSSIIHSSKKNPKSNLRDWDAYWDFRSLRPESLHVETLVQSDRGIPDGYRHMHGFGVNTFKLVNENNEAVYCKFHYLSNQGIKNLDDETARYLAGADPDYLTRDLYNAIEAGQFPSWTFYVQVMTYEQAAKWKFNPFDATKVWPHDEFPLIQVGQLVLNRNPDNHFAQVEQSAFDPGHMPPGIEPSPDKLLQGRLFSYMDTQRYRLGANNEKIPVNQPVNKVQTVTIRDGKYVFDDNENGGPNYFPNSFSTVRTDIDAKQSRFTFSGIPDIDRFPPVNEDDYSQVRQFWEKVLDVTARARLVHNLASSLRNAKVFIQKRMLKHLYQIHVDYGYGVELELKKMNSTACDNQVYKS